MGLYSEPRRGGLWRRRLARAEAHQRRLNGAGAHTNFSTKSMRADGGFKAILAGIERLSKAHAQHMQCYGKGNELRMTGLHETASYKTFKSGVADRGASIRIPRQSEID